VPRPHGVLFDLDGVLVDSRAAISGCMNHALAAHGFATLPADALYRFIGPPLALGFAELTASEPDSALVASCVRAYRECYRDAAVRETAVVPGIRDVLAGLARDHRLAVATSKARALAEPLLAGLGLRPCFDAVAGPGLDGSTEDKATTIGSALAALSCPRAVMVGDRRFDIAGAHAQGLPAIGVLWGIGDAAELEAAGADVIVGAPAELPAAVDRLLS
jgi:phosphoglycolate phosphatase